MCAGGHLKPPNHRRADGEKKGERRNTNRDRRELRVKRKRKDGRITIWTSRRRVDELGERGEERQGDLWETLVILMECQVFRLMY